MNLSENYILKVMKFGYLKIEYLKYLDSDSEFYFMKF